MTDQIEDFITGEQIPPEEEPTISWGIPKDPVMVYIQVDAESRITAINSSIFLLEPEGWVQIDEGFGDQYTHAQNQYLTKGLMDQQGCFNYTLDESKPMGEKAVERTEAEKQAEIDARPEPPTSEMNVLGQRIVELKLDPNPSTNAKRRRIFYTFLEEVKLFFSNKNPRHH